MLGYIDPDEVREKELHSYVFQPSGDHFGLQAFLSFVFCDSGMLGYLITPYAPQILRGLWRDLSITLRKWMPLLMPACATRTACYESPSPCALRLGILFAEHGFMGTNK
jgi:hypothetical protein